MQPASTWHREDATRYFEGERLQGYWWLGAAVVFVGAAFALRTEAFWPFVAVAAIQLAAGVMLLATSRGRVAKIDSWSAEHARIDRVNRMFVWIERVEVVALAAALVVAIAWPAHRWLFAGIAVQAAAMFALDHVAHRRAKYYAQTFVAMPEQRREIDEMLSR